jgi:hypothetical protein
MSVAYIHKGSSKSQLLRTYFTRTSSSSSRRSTRSYRPPSPIPSCKSLYSTHLYSTPTNWVRHNGLGRPTLVLTLKRYYASSSNDSETILLEGKSAGTASMLWDKYKYYALGSVGVIAAVGFVGLTVAAVALGGLVTIAGGAYVWYKSNVRHHQTVLRELYEPIIDNSRERIEKLIGPFEIPNGADIAADNAYQKSPTGSEETVVRNVFYLEGKYGKALVRALGVKLDDGSYKLRKLIIDGQDLRTSQADNIVLVDEPARIEYIDSPTFDTFPLQDFINIKNAAREANRKANKERLMKESEAAEEKRDGNGPNSQNKNTKNTKMYSNKPKKSGKESL